MKSVNRTFSTCDRSYLLKYIIDESLLTSIAVFSLPMIESQYKTEENLIKGCQSRVWLHAEYRDGKLFFTADSDAIITKGLVSLIIKVLSGQTPKDIVDADVNFIDAIGLHSHLSPTRSNGLLSMLKQIKLYALAYQAKSLQQ